MLVGGNLVYDLILGNFSGSLDFGYIAYIEWLERLASASYMYHECNYGTHVTHNCAALLLHRVSAASYRAMQRTRRQAWTGKK